MSYCRFSSDSFRSDLYVYEADDGVVIHVASNRLVLADDQRHPRWPDTDSVESVWSAFELDYRAFMDAVDVAERVDIGLSRDGRTYRNLTFTDAADLVRSLAAEGYRVPEGVADDLEAEAAP